MKKSNLLLLILLFVFLGLMAWLLLSASAPDQKPVIIDISNQITPQ